MKTKQVLIIGAGLGGLATAGRLAKMGFQVTVFDNHSRVGGKLNVFEKSGFRFDTGPSLITLPQVFEALYTFLGMEFYKQVKPLRLNSLGSYFFADGSGFNFSTDPQVLKSELSKFGKGEWDGWLKFLELGKKIYDLSSQTFLATPPSGWFKQTPGFKFLPPVSVLFNYHRLVAKFFKHPNIIQVLDRYPTYVGASPFKAPGMLAVIPYLEYQYQPHFLKGGLYTLADSLKTCLEQFGVSFNLNTRITRVRYQQSQVVGVEDSAGNFYPGQIVVYNGDEQSVYGLLGLPPKPISVSSRSLSGLVILLGLNERARLSAHHNVFFSTNYLREFAEIESQGFSQDPTVYVACPGLTDPSLLPNQNSESLFIMINTSFGHSHSWTLEKTQAAKEAIWQKLSAFGFRISNSSIQVEEIWTPDRFESEFFSPFGALYGGTSNTLRGAFLRPGLKHKLIQGLYFVGGSYHPGGGTPMVVLSAKMTVDLINRYENL